MDALDVLDGMKNRWAVKMLAAQDEKSALAAFEVAHVFVRAGEGLRRRAELAAIHACQHEWVERTGGSLKCQICGTITPKAHCAECGEYLLRPYTEHDDLCPECDHILRSRGLFHQPSQEELCDFAGSTPWSLEAEEKYLHGHPEWSVETDPDLYAHERACSCPYCLGDPDDGQGTTSLGGSAYRIL